MEHECTLGLQIIIPGVKDFQIEWIYNATFEIKNNYLYVKSKGHLDSIYNMANIARMAIR